MALGSLQATQGSWIVNGGSWNTGANWDAAVIPNGVGDTAFFTAFPSTGTYTVTATSDIALGSLFASQTAITYSFGANRLICDDPTSARLFAMNGTHTIANEVVFMGATTITADGFGKRWTITGPLTSGSPLARINLTSNSSATLAAQWLLPGLVLSANNTSAPPLTVLSGCLALTSAVNGIPVAPKNITLSTSSSFRGILRVIQGTDIFPHDSVITCEGGFFSVTSGPIAGPAAATDQTIGQLIVRGGSVGDTGDDTSSGTVLSTLTMTAAQPITIGGNGRLSVKTVILQNGGTILYDSSLSGQGFISNFGAGTDLFPYDLYLSPPGPGPQNIVTLNVPYGNNTFFDLSFKNINIQNGSLTKSGSGIVLFEGLSGALPLSFTISGGTVTMGGLSSDRIASQGNIIVNNGATLDGFGTFGGAGCKVTNQSGVVSPGRGEEVGTLTLNGDYEQQSGAVFQVFASGITRDTVSFFIVDGVATFLPGSVIQFLAADGGTYTQQARIPIVTANSLIADIANLNQFFIEQTPYHVDAELELIGNDIILVLNPLPSLTTLAADSGALEMAMENTTFTVERQNDMHMGLRGKIAQAEGKDVEGLLVNADEDNPFATGSRFKRATLQNPWTVYVAPLGSKGMVKKIRTQNALNFHSLGILVGADYTFERVGIGANLAYEKMRAHVHENWGHFSISNVLGRLYATMLPFKNDHFFFDLSGAIGSDILHINRNVNGMVAHGKPRGWTFNAYAQAGYDFLFGRWRVSPAAYCNYTYYIVEDYMEKGAGMFNVLVGHQNVTSLVPALGVNAGTSWETKNVTWLPEVRFNWERECCDINHKVKVTSLTFDTERMVPVLGGNRDFFNAGAGLRVLLGKHFGVYGSYDFYWSQYLRNNVFYGELRCYF